ncbi:chemotaxis protein CheW [Methanofollis sp. UBA420]|jgi:purine-binding chemotaxis protein CheW|uniref:chemotaxis protein CheW n=1 Tax=Methanofollis sp. UBA420 TaxID=1915514 RepID=UPI00316AC760
MAETVDVVKFELGGEYYALDIHLAREIVEMIPITPVPRAPSHIAGVINLRGEITNIIDLATLLNVQTRSETENRKIIVLVSEATGGSNLGIIVDDVSAVMQVTEADVEKMDAGLCREAYVKGIIKTRENKNDETEATGLVIWIDVAKVLEDLTGLHGA